MTGRRPQGRSPVSIVVPLHNEAKNVEPLFEEPERVTALQADVAWEYVFVDDGSRDDSLLILAKLARKHPKLKVVSLSRNFGKEVALSAGVTYAEGDAIVTMDADLQHPPSLLPELVAKWQDGAEVRGGLPARDLAQEPGAPCVFAGLRAARAPPLEQRAAGGRRHGLPPDRRQRPLGVRAGPGAPPRLPADRRLARLQARHGALRRRASPRGDVDVHAAEALEPG